MGLLLLFLTFGLMWVLVVIPQQRRMRQHQALVSSLRLGDEVITSAGVYGSIVSDDEDMLGLEVAPGVVLRVLRSSIGQRIGPADDEDEAVDSAPSEDET